MARYEVVVGNVGTVYSGTSERSANLTFATYVDRSLSGRGRCAGEPVAMLVDGEPSREYTPAVEFPEDTATVFDPRGFAHVGHLTDQRDEVNGTALYSFPSDFVAGDGTEAWLDPFTASDARALADYLSDDGDGFEWTSTRRDSDDDNPPQRGHVFNPETAGRE